MSDTTLRDIARLANVSVATVDRVIHGRGQPRPKTVARVCSAIEELGYRPNLAAAQLARGKKWRIGVLIPNSKVGFLENLAASIPDLNHHFDSLGVSVTLGRADSNNPVAFAHDLEAFAANLDACAVLALADPAVTEIVRQLENKNVRIAALISDIPGAPYTLFSGPDNNDMGATAGQLAIPVLRKSTGMAVIVKPESVQEDHEARFMGFCRALKTNAVDETRIRSARCPDIFDIEQIAAIISKSFKEQPVDVFYLTGGRNRPFVSAIETLGLDKPFIIGTDLTPSSRQLLIDYRMDAVVASDVHDEVYDAIGGLLRKLSEPLWRPENKIRPIQVFTRFNMPLQ